MRQAQRSQIICMSWDSNLGLSEESGVVWAGIQIQVYLKKVASAPGAVGIKAVVWSCSHPADSEQKGACGN